MSRYEGNRTKAGAIVTVNGELLDPRYDISMHNAFGFEWGHSGTGSAQLALAILADHLRNDVQAFNLHQRFKWSVVAGLPERWTLTSEEIERSVQSILRMEKGT